MDLSRYEESKFRLVRLFLHLILYVGKYLILFPVFAFFWFAILTVILTFLSENRTFPDILLMALVTVSTIRVTSYLSEDLSRDLAKILPFGVLAIFIIDASFFSVVASLDVLRDIRDYSERILYYLLFLIALEFAVRLIMGFAKFVLVRGKEPAPEEAGAWALCGRGEAAGRRGGDGGTLSGRAPSSCPCRRASGGGRGCRQNGNGIGGCADGRIGSRIGGNKCEKRGNNPYPVIDRNGTICNRV